MHQAYKLICSLAVTSIFIVPCHFLYAAENDAVPTTNLSSSSQPIGTPSPEDQQMSTPPLLHQNKHILGNRHHKAEAESSTGRGTTNNGSDSLLDPHNPGTEAGHGTTNNGPNSLLDQDHPNTNTGHGTTNNGSNSLLESP